MTRQAKNDPVRISRKDSTLLVVDVQEKLYPFISGHKEMTVEINRLIRFADIIGIPVLHVEQNKLGPTITEIQNELGDRRPIIKETFGSFGCAEFAEKMGGAQGKTLIITGIESHVCVFQTAMEALQRGFRVQVVADAASSRSPYNKEIALRRMTAAGVEVTVTEAVMFEIMARGNTDEFRKVLPLLK